MTSVQCVSAMIKALSSKLQSRIMVFLVICLYCVCSSSRIKSCSPIMIPRSTTLPAWPAMAACSIEVVRFLPDQLEGLDCSTLPMYDFFCKYVQIESTWRAEDCALANVHSVKTNHLAVKTYILRYILHTCTLAPHYIMIVQSVD